MKPLAGKTVLLGVTGSIAAFKAPHIVTRLTALGANVVVAMTENATRFVTPLTFESLSGNETIVGMWPEKRSSSVPAEDASSPDRLRHVRLAESTSLAIVAPATANIIGKLASGVADDFLSTELMAATCPVVIAPAMNVNMMNSAANTDNLETLRNRGFLIIEPDVGRLASGAVGRGRMPDPDAIVEAAIDLILPVRTLEGLRVVVTAGPTEEPLDPVRHIGNPSTGAMGYAVAEQAVLRGAAVVLVSGPTKLDPPDGVRSVNVRTTREMRDAVMAELNGLDVLVMAAAPADYRPVEVSASKLKKSAERLTLELERTEDILAEVAKSRRKDQVIVGFALETEDELENARRKLKEKRLDAIVVNNPGVEGAGFGVGTNVAAIVKSDGSVRETGLIEKRDLAGLILELVADVAAGRRGGEES